MAFVKQSDKPLFYTHSLAGRGFQLALLNASGVTNFYFWAAA
jgi:hypothetical protein